MMFRRSRWTEKQRYFVPPVNIQNFSGAQRIVEKLLNGYTVVVLVNDNGNIKHYELPGDAT